MNQQRREQDGPFWNNKKGLSVHLQQMKIRISYKSSSFSKKIYGVSLTCDEIWSFKVIFDGLHNYGTLNHCWPISSKLKNSFRSFNIRRRTEERSSNSQELRAIPSYLEQRILRFGFSTTRRIVCRVLSIASQSVLLGAVIWFENECVVVGIEVGSDGSKGENSCHVSTQRERENLRPLPRVLSSILGLK